MPHEDQLHESLRPTSRTHSAAPPQPKGRGRHGWQGAGGAAQSSVVSRESTVRRIAGSELIEVADSRCSSAYLQKILCGRRRLWGGIIYLLVWAWREHRLVSGLLRRSPES